MRRRLALHLFASAKGGVGKSTLAVVCAKTAARVGRIPLVIDADLLGTGLGEALELLAPELPVLDSELLDLEAREIGRLELAETRKRRLLRKATKRCAPRFLPYLNDALAFDVDGSECRLDSLIWHHRVSDGVRYLPSSSLKADLLVARQWLDSEREFEWVRRLCWLLDAAAEQMPDITDVVVDLPPGLWGFAHQALVLASLLARGESLPSGYPTWETRIDWSVAPWLVTSTDLNDLLVAIEYRIEVFERIPALCLAVNRCTESWETIQSRVVAMLGEASVHLELRKAFFFFDEDKSLRSLFKFGDVEIERLGPSFASLIERGADAVVAVPQVLLMPVQE